VTDVFDQASDIEQLLRDQAIARQRRESEERERSRQGGAASLRSECADCGDPIPERRRQAIPGCSCCTECEQAREARRRPAYR